MNNKCTAYSKMWFLTLLLITFVAGCASNAQEIPVIPDIVAPTVTFTAPANGQTAVPYNRKVSVAFSKAMDISTITTTTFTVTGPGLTPLPGTVSGAGSTATFTPTATFSNNTLYTATITIGAKDLAGNALASNYVFTFTTGAVADTTPPTVDVTSPTNTAIAVPINRKVTVGFSEVMNPLTITTASFTLTGANGTPVAGTVTPVGTSAVFTPVTNLANNTLYTATIKNSVKDLAGNAMVSNYVFTFTTGVLADNTAPVVTQVTPADLATNVAVNSVVTATFSKDMDPLTVSTATFTVAGVTGVVSYDTATRTATFKPAADLAVNTKYTATVTTGARDSTSNPLVNDKVWSFTTASVIVPPPASQLGTAGTYGIMATSTITSTGPSVINGDVALEPGSAMIGFPPATVNGTIHINDSVSHQAFIDLLTAYNYYKNLPPGVTITADADLGALYPNGIPPGTYTSGSGMAINTHLTLDGGGNANAVWVFQIGSSLTTTSPLGTISLINGANANNVFWVPTASATIGSGTTFYGTIVAGVSITGKTSAVINGRLLAGAIGAGAINLDSNVVNVPK